MKAITSLPEGYNEIFSVDLQRNKKMALALNLFALAITLIMVIPAQIFLVPIQALFDFSQGLLAYSIRFIVLILSLFAYIILHELVHGTTMKAFGAKNIKYGFTGLYAYAGCSDYFGKKSYITVALAPVVVWGIVLLIIQPFVPDAWFWVVYIIQIMNISGAVGDFYVTFKFYKMAKDIIVLDTGVSMTVYSKS